MGNRQKRLKARELWQQGFSAEDISKELSINIRTIRTWIRDIVLTEEQATLLAKTKPEWYRRYEQGLKLKQKARNRRMDYQKSGREKAQEESVLHLMATMLYWGEGSKARNVMSFINTDANMLKLFMRFLREELHIADELITLRIQHHTTDKEDVQRIIQYWLQWLELPQTTNVSTQLKIGTTSRKKRYINGICTIEVTRTEVVQHIFGAIQEYVGIDKPEWGK